MISNAFSGLGITGCLVEEESESILIAKTTILFCSVGISMNDFDRDLAILNFGQPTNIWEDPLKSSLADKRITGKPMSL